MSLFDATAGENRLPGSPPAQPLPRRLGGGKGRTSINVPAPVWQALRTLAEKRDRTIVAELSQAVAFWHFVADARSSGGRILVQSGQDQEVREVLFDIF